MSVLCSWIILVLRQICLSMCLSVWLSISLFMKGLYICLFIYHCNLTILNIYWFYNKYRHLEYEFITQIHKSFKDWKWIQVSEIWDFACVFLVLSWHYKNGQLLSKIIKMHFSYLLDQTVFSLSNLAQQIEQIECLKRKTFVAHSSQDFKFKTKLVQCLSPWFTDGPPPTAMSSHRLPFVYIHLWYLFRYKCFLSHKVICDNTLASPYASF